MLRLISRHAGSSSVRYYLLDTFKVQVTIPAPVPVGKWEPEVVIKEMKKARLLLPLFLLMVVPMTAQIEHAPMPEQCRADADAWSIPKWAVFVPNDNEFRGLPGTMIHNPSISSKTLEGRNAEFGQCEKTDNAQSTRYARAARAYAIAELARMGDFMERHSLTGQFYQEDEQGKR